MTAVDCNCGGRGYVDDEDQPRERYCTCAAGVALRELDAAAGERHRAVVAAGGPYGADLAARIAEHQVGARIATQQLGARIRDLQTLDTAVGWALSSSPASREPWEVAELRDVLHAEVEAARAR